MGTEFQPAGGAFIRGLLLCGLLSSVLYVIIDVIGAVNYLGYDYSAQAISEMSAVGAPTAILLSKAFCGRGAGLGSGAVKDATRVAVLGLSRRA